MWIRGPQIMVGYSAKPEETKLTLTEDGWLRTGDIWHAAWCWEEFFLPYFVAKGLRCYAPSLRGHGASPGSARLRTTRIRDYVDDVAETVAQLRPEPVLVGHSAGGFVVQKYLEEHTAVGMILLASISPTAAAETTVRTMVREGVLKAYGVGPATKSSRLEANPQRAGTVEVRHRWGTCLTRGLCRIYLAVRTGAGPYAVIPQPRRLGPVSVPERRR